MEAAILPETTAVITQRQDKADRDETMDTSNSMDIEATTKATKLSVPKLEASVSSSSLSGQDMAVFGTLNAKLADAFTETIEAAITDGVHSLPLLDGDIHTQTTEDTADKDKPPKQRLWEAIRYRFVRNVDVLEAYCGHNLLTLRKHPPATRKRIVAFLKNGADALPPLEAKENTSEEATETSSNYPTRSQLPSETETKQLAEEIEKLQADLQSAKEQRNALLAALESANKAQQAVEGVVATVQANLPEGPIQAQVGDKVEQGNTLGLLKDETQSLVRKLETIQQDRKPSQKDDSFDFVQRDDPLFRASNRAGNKRHKPLSLEEAYHKDRRQMGLLTDSSNNTAISVQALKSMAMSNNAPALRTAAPRTPNH